MSAARIRLQRSDIPTVPCVCPMPWPCVYRKDGACDDPRINKGNSDAACHKATNKLMVRVLMPLQQSQQRD